jgi:CO dehydrogenase/acetyl-CoA synthase beta subunit
MGGEGATARAKSASELLDLRAKQQPRTEEKREEEEEEEEVEEDEEEEATPRREKTPRKDVRAKPLPKPPTKEAVEEMIW